MNKKKYKFGDGIKSLKKKISEKKAERAESLASDGPKGYQKLRATRNRNVNIAPIEQQGVEEEKEEPSFEIKRSITPGKHVINDDYIKVDDK